MKKIAINSNILWTITNFRSDLIKDLQKNEYEVVLISSYDDFLDSTQIILKNLGVKFIPVRLSRKGLNPLNDISYLFQLIKIYKKEKPDIVLHYTIKPNIYGSIAGKLSKVKTISTVNGLGSGIIKNNILSKVLRILYKTAFKFPTKIYFQNKDDMQFFISKKIVDVKKTGYVPGSGININEFKLPVKKSTSEIKTFLFIGRILKDKGVIEYIDAIRDFKNESSYKAKFLLAGILDSNNPSGIKYEDVKGWENEGLIKYLGKTGNVKEFFKPADVIVLPSYREGLSRVLLEAASCGKPIITSNVPGCKEIVIDGESGFLCEPKDSKSLKDSFIKMLKLSDDSFEKFSKNAREIVINNYNIEIVNSIYLNQIAKQLSIKI